MLKRIKIWILQVLRKIVDSWFGAKIKELKTKKNQKEEEAAHLVPTGREKGTYYPPRARAGKSRRRNA